MKNLPFILLLISISCTPKLYEHRIDLGENELSSFLNHSNSSTLLVSAHRGGRGYPGYPENSIQAFAYTAYHLPAIIECDVRLSKDSVLLLLHDDDLDRTTTGTGPMKDKTWRELQKLKLVDDFETETSYHIPSLRHALNWGRGKVIFTLDVKRGIPFEKVVDLVEEMDAENYAAIITYNWKDAKHVHSLNPNLMISIGMRKMEDIEIEWPTSGIPANRILAFTGYSTKDPYEPPIDLIKKLQVEGIPVIYGRFGGDGDKSLQSSYQKLAENGIDIWTIDYPKMARKALPDYEGQKRIEKRVLNP
ncbi:MAG: glycerophosphodiester phosphodiesterase family protein [Bacteroidota bacterium]